MVTKRKAPQRARRRAPVSRAAPRRRRTTSGTKYIPAAAATVGLVAANAGNIKSDIDRLGTVGASSFVKEMTAGGRWKKYVTSNQLIKDGMYYGGAYIAGEVLKRYAPGVIKRPLGKIAKKIPRV